MRVLVTAGGTEEPIDAVRYIGNVSSGATGLAIASHLKTLGKDVYCIHHHRIDGTSQNYCSRSFRTFEDIQSALKEVLSEHYFDAIIHAAAVSDYRVSEVTVSGERRKLNLDGKIGSKDSLELHLEPTPKLLDSLKSWSRNPGVMVIGFKLTSQLSVSDKDQAVQSLLDSSRADLIVHNDIADVGPERHIAEIYESSGLVVKTETKQALAEFLANWLSLRINV